MAIRSNALSQIKRYATPAVQGTLFLLAVDAVTNLIDYLFHAYLGRALTPAEFAIVQTLNSLILILMTTFGVLQPVVARFVAESEAGGEQDVTVPGRIIFQHYFRTGAAIGFLLLAITFLLRQPLASWLNVPIVALSLALLILPLAFLRPVVAGLLQGQERMVAFGLTRTFHALGRFISAIILVTLIGMLGAVASFSIGAALALAAGLVFAGRSVWRPGPLLPSHYLAEGVRLAAAALVAYAAYMSLLNIDLIAVNRTFEPEVAGNYATAVLLRRVLTLVPGAIIVVMYPRAVAHIAQGQLPDSLLLKTATAIAIQTLALIALYFAYGSDIVKLAFGNNYLLPNWLLGWVAVGMMGYSFGAMWMSLYLATRPLPFVLLIVAVAVSQTFLYMQYATTLQQIAGFFTLGGWSLAVGGLLIYLLYLRPTLIFDSAFQAPKT